MTGNSVVIDILNQLLITEWTAIQQYKFNSEWNLIYGYDELSKIFYERYKDETKHAHHLIARILLLEGLPVIDNVGLPKQAIDIKGQYENDLLLEIQAVKDYDKSIHIVCCGMEGVDPDNETRRMLEKILKDEVGHTKEIEAQLKKINDMGISGYLQTYGK